MMLSTAPVKTEGFGFLCYEIIPRTDPSGRTVTEGRKQEVERAKEEGKKGKGVGMTFSSHHS
jgi:hypothetical protein